MSSRIQNSIFKLCWAFFALLICNLASAVEPVNLRLTVWDGDVSLGVIRGILKQFEAENPDIHVKLESISDYTLYHQKMLVQYAANVAPDVAMMDMGHFQALAKRKALMPLNQFFAKTPGFDLSIYYKPIVEAHSLNGQVYVLPRDIAPQGLIYYNKRLFDEAHIPYPDGSWTWDFQERPELKEKDFVWVCHQLTKKDSTGKIKQWGYASGTPELLAQTLMFSTGQNQANDPQHPTKILMDRPEVVKAYQFAGDFMNKLKYMPNSTETSGVMQQTTQQLFVSEKIAMYQNGIWEVPNMRKAMTPGKDNFFEWDITLFPAYKDGTRAAPTGGSGYGIFSSTQHPDQAWRLTKYMSGPVAMTAMARAGIAQPAIRSLALTKDVWLVGPNTPPEQRYPPSREFTDKAVPFVKFSPTADYWPAASERLSSGLELLWSGQSEAKPILERNTKAATERMNALLKQENLPLFNWGWGAIAMAVILGAAFIWVYLPERGTKYSSREKSDNRMAYLFLSPWLIGMLAFTVGPMVLSLVMSFTDWDIIQPARFAGVNNYVEAGVVDPIFWKSLTVTAIYTCVSVPLGMCGSLALALLLNQKVRGVPIFRAIYYVPSLASGVAAILIWRKIFNPENGLINAIIYGPHGSFLGNWLSNINGTPGARVDWLGSEKFANPALIMMSVWGAGGGMVILLAGLQGIPQFYYEAATLDGAGIWKRFQAVTLPLLTPTLFFSLVTGLIGSFQVFTQAFVGTQGGPNDATRYYMLHLWNQAFSLLRMGYAAAGAWILFVIILLVTLFQFKVGNRWVYYENEAK